MGCVLLRAVAAPTLRLLNIVSALIPPSSFATQARKASQRSLQDAPIFRLLLKVAVKGTHQCDFTNFWGSLGLPTTRKYVAAAARAAQRCHADQRLRCDRCRLTARSNKTRATTNACAGRAADAQASILAEGAMTLPVTLSGGVLFAS